MPGHADGVRCQCLAAVLDGLEVLDVTVAGVPFREAVRPAYDRLIAARGADAQDSGYSTL
ncbi:MAG: hypothetical protein M3450_14515 [Actinomycetota bacterium]|nr:hypothetical protein [Actinomycetota bacterium]